MRLRRGANPFTAAATAVAQAPVPQAIVTPLGTGRFNSGDNFTFNVYAQPGQSAQEIALAVKRVFLREDAQRRAVYA